MSAFVDKMTGAREDKARWKHYRTRVTELSDGYRIAVEALERYLMRAGSQGHDASVSMWEDLVDLFEQAEADGTAIRLVVGDDPVEFADAFSANYGTSDWRSRERQRLIAHIEQAQSLDPAST